MLLIGQILVTEIAKTLFEYKRIVESRLTDFLWLIKLSHVSNKLDSNIQ